MHLLHPNEKDKALPQLTFIDPGAGTGEHPLQKWLIALYEKMSKGKTQEVLRLLQEKGLPPGTPLTTSVLSSGEGVEACFALPLACLMTSRRPEKVLKTLSALKKKGYVWKTTCTLEKRPLPWEVACALAWVTLYQRLETIDHMHKLSALLNERGGLRKGEDAHLAHLTEAHVHRDSHAFVQSQGGNPELLTQPDQIKALVALSVYTTSPVCPQHVGMFLKESSPSLLKEAWNTPWQSHLLSPATQLAHRLWACVSTGYHSPVIHRDDAGTLIVPSPATLLRCWRSAWDTSPLSEGVVRAKLSKVHSLSNSNRTNTPHTVSAYDGPHLESYKSASKIAEGWYTVPGGRYALQHLNSLEPLPYEMLPPGLLLMDWQIALTADEMKDVQRQFLQHNTARTKHMQVPKYARQRGWRTARLHLFSSSPSNNKVLMVSPYEPRQHVSLLPKETQEGRDASDTLKTGRHENRDVPTAADVLLCWSTWMRLSSPGHAATRELVDTLQAFEKHAGAPFTFKVGTDARRWSIHGYLWGRGTARGEEASHALSKAGYPPWRHGYAVVHTNAQGEEEMRVEPLEVCVVQRLDTLLADNAPSDVSSSSGLSSEQREALTTCVTRLAEAGYVLDMQSPAPSGRPLYQTAAYTMHLRTVFPLYLWMVEQGVSIQNAGTMIETISARITVGEKSKYWGKKAETLASSTALTSHLEQQHLQETLQMNEERPSKRSSARPRL